MSDEVPLPESQTNESDKTAFEVAGGALAWIVARVFVVATMFFPFVLGCFVGGVGLHDPDTCWLLSLGRFIFEHRALPTVDPFSYSFALQPGKVFVLYQWLTELTFYLVYLINGLPSLLSFTAIVLGESFLVLPVILSRRSAPALIGCLLAMVGVCASCFHFLVRPEISSYLCMSVALLLLRRIYTAKNGDAVQWTTVAAMTILTLIWANMHSAFVLGLILQLALIVFNQLQAWFEKREFLGSLKSASLALLGSLLATFCNPYGVGLWMYLPSLFFAKFNYRIAELRPIRLNDLSDPTYYPFLLFIVIVAAIIGRALILARKANLSLRLSNIAIILICVFYGFACRRIIPFSVLMIIPLVSELWVNAPTGDEKRFSFWSACDRSFQSVFEMRPLIWSTMVAVLCVVGCVFTFSKALTPTIPQGSASFKPPVELIEYLRTNRPSGNVLNDAQFGDMLIWYAPEIPVLIDTRYDMHGEQTVSDYVSMMSATNNWRELLQRYKIDWVFVPPAAEILTQLRADSAWSVAREDKTGVIVKRAASVKSPTPSSQ